MAPKGAAYEVDWVFSNNSNVHLAKHRDWFTTFTAFKSYAEHAGVVLGIGDVELDAKRYRNRHGKKATRKIVLHEVLYVPTALCNILGAPIVGDFNVTWGGKSPGLKDKITGGSAGLFDNTVSCKLWLVGHEKGKSSLDPNGLYWITTHWPASERGKWKALNETGKMSLVDSRAASLKADKSSAEYTPAEKAWLKRAFGGEFHFLLAYGLNLHKDEDRVDGRNIARAMIEKEASEDVEDYEDSEGGEEEEENQFLADLESDPTSHLADHFFSETQLDWIEKHYRHSGNFLLTHGLKPFDDEDCEEGVAVVRAFMQDGDESP